jgi:hypothetical protein
MALGIGCSNVHSLGLLILHLLRTVINVTFNFIMLYIFRLLKLRWPITVAAPSKARNAFSSSNIGIMGSNPTQGMDVCFRLFYVCFVLYR